MRIVVAVVLALASGSSLLAQTAAQPRLTFEDSLRGLRWGATMPSASIAWDGKHVVLTEVDERGATRALWFEPATGTMVEPKPAQASSASEPAAAAKASHRATIDGGNVVLERGAGETADRGNGRRRGGRSGEFRPGERVVLTDDGAAHPGRREAHASGDGAFVSYVEGNNLFVVGAADRQTWQATKDGSPELFHGLLDWVYQEEVYGRGDFQGHWWSPTGGMCAFLTLDESPVKDYPIVEHVPEGYLDRERSVGLEIANYPKAGDPNPIARLSVAHATARKVVPLDLSAYPKDALVVRVEWTDDSRLLVMLQDRIQTWCDLCEADPKTGTLTRWIREESKTWTNRPDSPRWLPDGTFLWLSERTGYQHVYHYARGGKLLGAVTEGDWQVRAIERIDAARGLLWFEGTKDGAAGRHLYRIGLDGKGLALLTPGPGTHQALLAPDGSFLIDLWSATDRAPTVRVLDGADGRVLRDIGRAPQPETAQWAFAPKQLVAIAARDGYVLDATVQRPLDWAADRRFPVFLDTYSGPDAPTVRDAWSHSPFHQFLAGQGFLVLQVNVRSASNRGQVHTGTCYRQLGVQELKDLEDAVDYVVREHAGDPARVAISGWSYGGFITAYALTHSGKFALGLAGAGVYDWRLYDSIYTERYMGLPEANAEGYDATSVIKAARNLKGHLVLMHGTMDDNVHLQNTIQLVWELEKANQQDFELMLYPRSQHGLSREVRLHQQTYQWRVLRRLQEPKAAVR